MLIQAVTFFLGFFCFISNKIDIMKSIIFLVLISLFLISFATFVVQSMEFNSKGVFISGALSLTSVLALKKFSIKYKS